MAGRGGGSSVPYRSVDRNMPPMQLHQGLLQFIGTAPVRVLCLQLLSVLFMDRGIGCSDSLQSNAVDRVHQRTSIKLLCLETKSANSNAKESCFWLASYRTIKSSETEWKRLTRSLMDSERVNEWMG